MVELPGARNELHGADGSVEVDVAVENASVGVANQRQTLDAGGPARRDRAAVERDAQDVYRRVAVYVQRRFAKVAVEAFDAANASELRPMDSTARVFHCERA